MHQPLLLLPPGLLLGQFFTASLLGRLQLGQSLGVVTKTDQALALQLADLQLALAQRVLQVADRARRRGEVDGHPGTGGIEHVNSLVRQLTAGDVTGGELGGSLQRLLVDQHPVGLLVDAAQAAQDHGGLVGIGLTNLHQLEAARQGRVFFHVFLVLAPGGGGDGAQLAPGQRRLDEVGNIQSAGLVAGPDQGMRLVDKEDDRLHGVLDLLHHPLEAFLELPLDRGAGLHGTEIQGHQLDPAQLLGHLARHHAQGQPLDEGALADTGLTHHDGVVLATTGEDVDHQVDFVIPAEHGIQAALAGLLGHIDGEAGQQAGIGRQGCLGRLAAGGRGHLRLGGLLDPLVKLLAQQLAIDLGEHAGHRARQIALGGHQQHQQHDAAAQLGVLQLGRGEQPAVLQPLNQHGRKGGVTLAIAAVGSGRLQQGLQLFNVDLGHLQDLAHVAQRGLQHLEQQVLDTDLGSLVIDAEGRSLFQHVTADGVESFHQYR
ncbi:hypothetical protein D3C84_476720 [compost metagenome]